MNVSVYVELSRRETTFRVWPSTNEAPLSAQGAIPSLRLRVIEVYARPCPRFFYCRPGELLSLSGRLVFARSAAATWICSRNVTLVRGWAHCEGMNDVAIIAAVLCCAAEDGGSRNEEAFNEIICAPSAVCAAPTALKFRRAPKSLIFTRLIRVSMFSSRETERENFLYKCENSLKLRKVTELKNARRKKN